MTSPGEQLVPSDDKIAEITALHVDVEIVARSFGLTDRDVAALDRMIASGKPVMDKTGMIVLFKRQPGTRSSSPSAQGDMEGAL